MLNEDRVQSMVLSVWILEKTMILKLLIWTCYAWIVSMFKGTRYRRHLNHNWTFFKVQGYFLWLRNCQKDIKVCIESMGYDLSRSHTSNKIAKIGPIFTWKVAVSNSWKGFKILWFLSSLSGLFVCAILLRQLRTS